MKKVLNVGGNNKTIPIPSCFDGWQHDLLDIDPKVRPDILCDARELWKLPPRQYDAIYCSHNLEHYFSHDVPKVLKGFKLLLKQDGFAYINVPDLVGAMEYMLQYNLELDDEIYMSSVGSIAMLDFIFGHRKKIEASGVDFFMHKTGFSISLLQRMLKAAGFPIVLARCRELNIKALAFMKEPSAEIIEQLELGKL